MNQVQLDSLYIKFIQLRAPELLPQTDQLVDLTLEDRKCGFGIVNSIKTNIDRFSTEQQNILKSFLSRPVLQTSIVSPSGFFRIHYDATGTNRPSYVSSWSVEQNVAEVANALDSVYRFEITYLGYPVPPTDGVVGGDDKYDIYIRNLSGVYGQTWHENSVGTTNWTSYIEIDNDFGTGFYTHGIEAARVTVAHEFHHSIQLGNYAQYNNNTNPIRGSDLFFYEITSTSMEEFVFDDVNDYYNYIYNYTNDPSRRFDKTIIGSLNGYDLAIWNIYLIENFDFGILKRQWELMPTIKALAAISNTFTFKNTTFAKEYNKFGIWTYYTGIRAIPGLYFDEAEYYPLINPLATISYPQYTYADIEAEVVSNNFIKFNITANGDILYSIISNGDINAAINEPQQTYQFRYTLFSDTLSGNRKLSEKYSSNFTTSNIYVWSISEILNDKIVLQDSIELPKSGDIKYAYPNPFNYKSNLLSTPFIFFPFTANVGETVDFNVYSVGMQIVFSNQMSIQILPGDQRGVSWNGFDNEGGKLASGVYIYVIKQGDEVVKGKVVIFNE